MQFRLSPQGGKTKSNKVDLKKGKGSLLVTSNVMIVSSEAKSSISSIEGGADGQLLTLIF